MKQINNKYGTASLVTSISGLALMFMPYMALPLSILAIILAAQQKKHYAKTGNSQAGLVMGIIGTVINATLLFWTIIGLLFISAFA